jgi:hypothetical protein
MLIINPSILDSANLCSIWEQWETRICCFTHQWGLGLPRTERGLLDILPCSGVVSQESLDSPSITYLNFNEV